MTPTNATRLAAAILGYAAALLLAASAADGVLDAVWAGATAATAAVVAAVSTAVSSAVPAIAAFVSQPDRSVPVAVALGLAASAAILLTVVRDAIVDHVPASADAPAAADVAPTRIVPRRSTTAPPVDRAA